jgi:hypothetical protein
LGTCVREGMLGLVGLLVGAAGRFVEVGILSVRGRYSCVGVSLSCCPFAGCGYASALFFARRAFLRNRSSRQAVSCGWFFSRFC